MLQRHNDARATKLVPGHEDGTPGINKKNEEDQRNNTTRNLSDDVEPRRTPTPSDANNQYIPTSNYNLCGQ